MITGSIAAMAQNTDRPISPHLQIYRWSPTMAASIFHRATGFVLATAGMLALLWWLYAIGQGAEAYATFQSYAISAGEKATGWQLASNWFFRLLGIAVTWSFFQHFFSGLRHLLMDMGAGYELNASRNGALMVFIASTTATGIVALLVASRFLGV
jgi:succinate dehydrogenase / fumarate reductase, cytochrome b subunit